MITGKFKDPLTGLEITIGNAIKKNVIKPDFDPEEFLSGKKSIAELMKAGKVDPNSTILTVPECEPILLKDALMHGYVSPDSVVSLDKQNGDITLADESLVGPLQALVETKAQLDWLDQMEGELAKLGRPAEDRADVEHQLNCYEVGEFEYHIR